MAAAAFLRIRLGMTSPTPSGLYDGFFGAAARRAGALRLADAFFDLLAVFFAGAFFFAAFFAMIGHPPRKSGPYFVHGRAGRSSGGVSRRKAFLATGLGHLVETLTPVGVERHPAKIRLEFRGIVDLGARRALHAGGMNAGDDLRPSLESLRDRRFRGDLCEPLQLLPGERRGKMNLPLDAVRFTLLVIIELDPDRAQLPALPLRVHAQRDRGAGPQRREQKTVRGGPGVGAAVRMRL